jgi:hypothetical protein
VIVQKEGRSRSWYPHVVLPAPLRPYIWRLLVRKTNFLENLTVLECYLYNWVVQFGQRVALMGISVKQ